MKQKLIYVTSIRNMYVRMIRILNGKMIQYWEIMNPKKKFNLVYETHMEQVNQKIKIIQDVSVRTYIIKYQFS